MANYFRANEITLWLIMRSPICVRQRVIGLLASRMTRPQNRMTMSGTLKARGQQRPLKQRIEYYI